LSSGEQASRTADPHRLLISTLMMLAAVSPLVSSLGAPLVPQIAEQFDVSLSAAQWTLTGPLLLGAVSAPVIGRLGEGARRRPVVVLTMAVVLSGTVLAALPFGFEVFLVGRIAQGAGFGLLPMAMSIARDVVPPDRRDATIASLSVAATVGAGIGFPLATALAELAGVRGAYVFGAVVSVGIALLAARTVPDRAGARRSVDLVEAVQLGVGSAMVLLGVSQANAWGWRSGAFLGCVGGGALLLLLWGRRSLRMPAPMIDLRVAGRRPILAVNVTAVLVGASMYAVLALATLIVQTPEGTGGLGLSVFVSGLLMLPYSAAGWGGGVLARRLGWSPERILPLGCIAFGIANLLLVRSSDSLWGVLVAMSVAGLGGGLAFAALPVVVVRHVSADAAANALGANHVVRALGFAVGSAVSVALVELFGDAGAVSASGVGGAGLVVSTFGVGAALVSALALRPRRTAEVVDVKS
jgi:predicted MFS family arabinose efflux permease